MKPGHHQSQIDGPGSWGDWPHPLSGNEATARRFRGLYPRDSVARVFRPIHILAGNTGPGTSLTLLMASSPLRPCRLRPCRRAPWLAPCPPAADRSRRQQRGCRGGADRLNGLTAFSPPMPCPSASKQALHRATRRRLGTSKTLGTTTFPPPPSPLVHPFWSQESCGMGRCGIA